jgi:hypothetical protein
MARLTVALLGPEHAARIIGDYLDSVPCTSLFFVPETLGFLEFVIQDGPAVPHLDSIARFEKTLLGVAEVASSHSQVQTPGSLIPPTAQIRRHPAAAIISFAAPAEHLIGALLSGAPIPGAEAPDHPILVAPGLPYLWRPATAHEVCLFASCQPPAAASRLMATIGGNQQPLAELLTQGALCLDP